ncbi:MULTISPECIES: ABC transporter substrate-binding protein [Tatumella]|uniref:ABC transporter substrate-binding protein n=1 Tax=Tatumella punctata TaxID=399969 RepID=A0ABW1VNR2_9GAMM|nr:MULTISPECIES: ABC transporter substrate-binding protein [unclassified Tatumella]MBS0857605.1 ABC transporter substrate-binding protein [Tatumella sp. JGM16]MBS0876538.1 ABC transporter substrate-binding protein [Tatumella sp. JGM82]MBS0890075.1 ABC transporter substrate-binding protein [Tatumella sp. JGM94]MBS0895036.1 ABC transporter substrate-binding protein [Tatumella sp. JGM130]MBS0901319.1 ABC transporter substrate-binding protein [Tatumella sp. JGM100]
MIKNTLSVVIAGLIAGALVAPVTASAEGNISIAQQFGIGYLLLDVVRDQHLIEQQGKKEGLDIKVDWRTLSGATTMNEAVLTGALDVAAAGVPAMLTVWDRTYGHQNVKAIAALGSMPGYLLSNNPAVKSIHDLSEKDRIAAPAAGVGFQSRTLQIATAELYGNKAYNRFDNITVSLPHPDATVALISGKSEITAHFSSPPFQYQELDHPGIHKILSSYDVLGGPGSFNVLYTTQKFHDENPETYQAFYNALVQAAEYVEKNKDDAARIYIRQENSHLPLSLIEKIINDPQNHFTVSPERTYVYADKLNQLGVLKHHAASWKDYFFSEAQVNPGS